MKYSDMTAADLVRLRPYFSMRPNKSCDSAPLCVYLFRHYYNVLCYEDPGKALILMFMGGKSEINGFIPYCLPEDVPKYFRLQEQYFNSVLQRPLIIHSADEEGVEILKACGALDNYGIIESSDLKDYLYSAEDLKTLAGRKYSKKRNHIKKFLSAFDGRWQYRTITPSDSGAVLDFLTGWMDKKLSGSQQSGTNEANQKFDASLELKGEFDGISELLSSPGLLSCVRIGGIFIDGRPEGFSIGDYNPAERIAIIDVEKANEELPGIYQMLNREFLLHEYPDAVLVNREDDVGIEGLRQSKLSYYPCGYEHKYSLLQKDFRPQDTCRQ